MEPPLTLRNYMFQCARQHTVIDNIGLFSIYFSKKYAIFKKSRNLDVVEVLSVGL